MRYYGRLGMFEIHRFYSRRERDTWAKEWGGSPISRREAERIARRMYQAPLDAIPEVRADESVLDGPWYGELAFGKHQ
jgi:hypothetical protein